MQAVGYGISNSLLFFVHVATFTYGSKLVESGEMTVEQVFRYRLIRAKFRWQKKLINDLPFLLGFLLSLHLLLQQSARVRQ